MNSKIADVACRSVTTGVDSTLYLQDGDVIVGGPFEVKDGCIPISNDPGLGVEIDEVAVQRAKVEDLVREI